MMVSNMDIGNASMLSMSFSDASHVHTNIIVKPCYITTRLFSHEEAPKITRFFMCFTL